VLKNNIWMENKHRTWWRKCTDESVCLCTQMSGSNLIEGIWCG